MEFRLLGSFEAGHEGGARGRTRRPARPHAAGRPRLDRPPAPLYAVRVGDQWLPWSAGGHPALEFCNTYAGWGADPTGVPTPGSDWLRGYPTLAVRAGHHDLADGPVVEALLRRAAEQPRRPPACSPTPARSGRPSTRA